MSFNPLTKEKVRELEMTTTDYLNILGNDPDIEVDPFIIHNFHNWSDDNFNERGDPTGIFFKGLYEKVRCISGKLGMKQTYYVNHSSRNAVWGFEYLGKEYLLYFSNEGLSLQMSYGTSASEVVGVIEEIIKHWRAQ